MPPPPTGSVQGWGQSGECPRKNRSLCTSAIFIAHKLGGALTPARRAQALEGVEASPATRRRALSPRSQHPGPPRPPGLRPGTCGTMVASAAGVWIGHQEAPKSHTCTVTGGQVTSSPGLVIPWGGGCGDCKASASSEAQRSSREGPTASSPSVCLGPLRPQFRLPAASSSFQPLEFLPNL